MYADTAAGRAEAVPGAEGTCPSCGQPVRPKCGGIVVHHWAHHARTECDPWSEPESEWHRAWKLTVPPERREVVMGSHRADIVTASAGVVELQHSAIAPEVIAEREEFFGGRMAWIFDATTAQLIVYAAPPVLANTPCGCVNEQCTRIWLQPGTACRCLHEGCTGMMAPCGWEPSPEVLFCWRYARRSLSACRRLVFLDLGDGTLLRIRRFEPASEMTGVLYTSPSVQAWLRDGAKLERITLPPAVPLSSYDPPIWERHRTPDAWRADEEQRHRWVLGTGELPAR
jgi:hypothetical protein